MYLAPLVAVFLFLVIGPPFLDTAIISQLTKILCFGLLAMSLDVAFGYTGLWSFGHAGIFGVAAYTTMLFFKYTAIHNFWIITPVAILMAAIVAAVFAAVAARSSGLYFLLITLALGQLVYCVAVQWKPVTNGDDGLWGLPYPQLGFPFSNISYYYFTLAVVALCAFLLYRFTRSPFGYSLVGIRENEVRARTMGYNTRLRKLIAFVISGSFAGLAGILYVYFNGGIAPENVGMYASGMAMIMVIIGGTATLWGGFVGSAVVLLSQYYISQLTPARWPIFLGALFIAAGFFAGGGIFPRLACLWKKAVLYGDAES
ncbi:MAG: branched-chain amino acid ABC transporter permease [Xanthobacteraceae bacterium]